ncbi:MAG: protein kinase, partial [Deltaproteobacteria bacterium]|nr:protein kinase [Deltaproteobacteria bacterium]
MDGRSKTTGFTFSDREMPVRFGRYHLLERGSVDPIGEEFLAAWGVDEGVDQLRSLRCVYPAVATESEFVALFSEEARSLSRLSSDNVVRVMEVGLEGEIPFVAREHVEGVSLGRLIDLADKRKSLWPWELAAHVTAEALRGLDYVHRREDIHGRPMGMRHGDVRPGNVLVSFGGEVKLTNFGTSLRFIVDEKTNARLKEIRRRYLPPEGADEVEPAVAADLWGAGMILLHLLASGVPFKDSAEVTAGWVPPAMASRVEAMPGVLDTFLARALNPDPQFRFIDADEMRSALVAIIGEHVAGHPPDDLAAWTRDLGQDDAKAESELVRKMLGREAELRLDDATDEGALVPGTVLDGRYHLLRVLGEGGMGLVFEAEHLGLGRRVAVKVLHDRVLDDANAVERFRREAQIIGGLGHPNIVGASDFGVTQEGHHYLAMDLLDGVALTDRIHKRDLSPRELAEIMAEVCDGLEAAHAAEVIHRDLKPDNIYLTSNGARILDFGIAKRTGLEEQAQALTRTGHICGTVEYIAPEQIRGLSHDPRSDLYAVGVIMYEALTGETPYHGRTVGETLHRALNGKLVPPRKRTGDRTIPADLEAVCVKALARKADKRYQSAAELAAALRALLPGEGETTEIKRSSGRSPVLIAAAVVGVILVVTTLGLLMFASDGSDEVSDLSEPSDEVSDAPDTSDQSSDQADDSDTAGTVVAVEDAGSSDDVVEVDAGSAPLQAVDEKAEVQERAADLAKQGRAELKRMRLDKAGALFREALEADPKLSSAWFGLGRVAYEQARYGEAESKVRRALRFRSRSAKYRNFLGQILLTQGKKDAAIAEWKKVLSMRP